MNYKLEGALKKSRKSFIICAILWLVLVIVFVGPFSYSAFEAKVNGSFELDIFLEQLSANITNPFGTLASIFANGAAGDFNSFLLIFSVIYIIIFFIGFSKMAPKSEYENIEHGSSDWSQNGEQYRVLSKNNGIILAENNYLPVDKRGNTNVLVVGRIRFW